MRLVYLSLFLICSLSGFQSFSQVVMLKGFVFADDNSGYLNEVKITVLDQNKSLIGRTVTNLDGAFEMEVPANELLSFRAEKNAFNVSNTDILTKPEDVSGEVYIKIPMSRAPGYIFEVTLAEYRAPDSDGPVDAIDGATIELYNKTRKEEELVLKNHPGHIFNVSFEPGNSYEMMIRKKGFFTKRMEIDVAVDGCILCMDGFGSIRPGVQDNLTAGHQAGTLASDISLKRVDLNETIEINNIFYDLGKWDIRPEAAIELDNLVGMLKINPRFVVELSSHTDSRGTASSNQSLSQKRAESAVNYLVGQGIERSRMIAVGYGERKIKNICKDGVTCSEELHQENRRTEIQVIGYSADTTFMNRSFKDIIEEEMLMAELMQLDQTVIQVPISGDSALLDSLKNQAVQTPNTVGGLEINTKPSNSLLGQDEDMVPIPRDTSGQSKSINDFDSSIEAMALLDREIIEKDPELPTAGSRSLNPNAGGIGVAPKKSQEDLKEAASIQIDPEDLKEETEVKEEIKTAGAGIGMSVEVPEVEESPVKEIEEAKNAGAGMIGESNPREVEAPQVEEVKEEIKTAGAGIGMSVEVPEVEESPVKEIKEAKNAGAGMVGESNPTEVEAPQVEEVKEEIKTAGAGIGMSVEVPEVEESPVKEIKEAKNAGAGMIGESNPTEVEAPQVEEVKEEIKTAGAGIGMSVEVPEVEESPVKEIKEAKNAGAGMVEKSNPTESKAPQVEEVKEEIKTAGAGIGMSVEVPEVEESPVKEIKEVINAGAGMIGESNPIEVEAPQIEEVKEEIKTAGAGIGMPVEVPEVEENPVKEIKEAKNAGAGMIGESNPIEVEAPQIEEVKEEIKTAGAGIGMTVETPEVEESPVKEIKEAKNAGAGMIEESSPESTEIIEEEESIEIPDFRKVPADYSGFKIQLLSTSKLLDSEHRVFREFGKVKIEQSERAFHYLMGDFDTQDAATSFLKTNLENRFPNAQVVEMEYGGIKYD